MAHIVCRKGRYYSLEESYREGKKVRKRTLFYFGTRRPSDPQARYEQMIATAERKAEEIDAMQREKFGETASELRERLEDEARFASKAFLEATAAAEKYLHRTSNDCRAGARECCGRTFRRGHSGE